MSQPLHTFCSQPGNLSVSAFCGPKGQPYLQVDVEDRPGFHDHYAALNTTQVAELVSVLAAWLARVTS